MPHVTEPTFREYLWEFLEDDFGYTVGGEVNLGDGFIDIVAETPSGEYYGYEVKDQARLEAYDKEEDLLLQLRRYRDSGFLDRLYYCSENPGPMVDKIREIHTFNFVRTIAGPSELGGIRFNLQSVSDPDPSFEVVREAEPLRRTCKPTLSRTNEAWVQHHVWKFFGDLREAPLPNRTNKGEQRVDIIGFEGSSNPTDILRNQADYSLRGIEVKGDKLSGNSNTAVREQLQRYLNSGGLTHLSLAVPHDDRKSALKLLDVTTQSTLRDFGGLASDGTTQNNLERVGLFTVDTHGRVETIRKPTRVEMKYDGYRVPGTYGRCKSVGWGRAGPASEFDSLYNPKESSDGTV